MCNTEERYWLLVSLILSGEATEDESAELMSFIKDHPERGKPLQALIALWNKKKENDPVAFNDFFERLVNKL